MFKQISVFLDNKPGMLNKVTHILKENKIDMRALTLADGADYGILRAVVDDTEKAVKCLGENGYITKVNHVIAVVIDDAAGGLSGVIDELSRNNINIEYLYVFVTSAGKNACAVIRVKDYDKAAGLLSEKKFKLLDSKAL